MVPFSVIRADTFVDILLCLESQLPNPGVAHDSCAAYRMRVREAIDPKIYDEVFVAFLHVPFIVKFQVTADCKSIPATLKGMKMLPHLN